LVGTTPAIPYSRHLSRLSAKSVATVLILVQFGTVMEMLAQSLHPLSSLLHFPFFSVNFLSFP
ncbi:hypothetical protein OIV58_31550, partial [Burkholderia pseudomallei]|nr:hypothetical protein [Burkholderia pseudomallei]